MKKHISEVELCGASIHDRRIYCSNNDNGCSSYHSDDFCLLCGYEMEGDRLYLEIHGSNGALNRVKDIDSSQPYVCMECADSFTTIVSHGHIKQVVRLTTFIKKGKT